MITKTISHVLGAPIPSSLFGMARGETLTISLAVTTTAGVAANLTGSNVALGWATAAGTGATVTRVAGGPTGIVTFTVETETLAESSYTWDIWLEDAVTYDRTRVVGRSLVRLSDAVAPMNLAPAITMAALASTVPPGALAISGTATDSDGTLTAASFSVTVNGVAQTPTFTFGAGAWSASVTVAVGAAVVVVTVTDGLGTTSSATRSTTVATELAYYGVGATGRTDTVGLASVPVVHDFELELTLSPVAEKFYLISPLTLGTPTVMLDGFHVDLLQPTTLTVGAASYYLFESENLLTGDDLLFIVSP